jgi:glucoamylase
MPQTHYTRAEAGADNLTLPRIAPQPAFAQVDFSAVAQHMFGLMLRNISSAGFAFSDPADPGRFSQPGCVIAAPSYPAELPTVNQDYVFNWVRDAALTAMELVAAAIPDLPGDAVQALVDYVNFAALCQGNATPTLGHACFTIEGQSRPWSEQNDGPALQVLAMLQAFAQLDSATQTKATRVIGTNLQFLLEHYQDPTYNLWEEHQGQSFFARAAQLRCLQTVASSSQGITAPPGTEEAIAWLQNALGQHWNDGAKYYMTLLDSNVPPGYDPNIDIVMASIYGAIPCTDTKLLSTAAQLRPAWANSESPTVYQINIVDNARGLGPMFGRYPGDSYDGDNSTTVGNGHPWALCTCNFAQLYYELAGEIAASKTVPLDNLSQEFFEQVGVSGTTSSADAVTALRSAGDALLQAVMFHSDHLELSEQFDGTTGYEKSVQNLTWSYASFLSAVRARNAIGA